MKNRLRISKALLEASWLAIRGKSVKRHVDYITGLQKDLHRPAILTPPNLRIGPLDLTISEGQDQHLNVLLPTIDPLEIFGGTATAIMMAAKLYQNGIPIRLIVTERPPLDHHVAAFRDRWLNLVETSSQRPEVWDGTSIGQSAKVGRRDWFLATWWRTAWVAQESLKKFGFPRGRLAYFIQDFEPGFYPWSPDYVLALATYSFDAVRIVNTTYLAQYLKNKCDIDIEAELIVRPSLNKTMVPSLTEIVSRKKRRLVMYGRPNSPRNLFQICLAALDIFVSKGSIEPNDLEIMSAGEEHPDYRISNRHVIRSVGKLSIEDYVSLLRDSDIGLSLMLSPHPSYPPLEMAASGMLVVTNTFSSKAMHLSDNILAVEPTPAAIADGLKDAYGRISDGHGRLSGAKVDLEALGLDIADVASNVAKRVSCSI